jgi:cation transporter-like permease
VTLASLNAALAAKTVSVEALGMYATPAAGIVILPTVFASVSWTVKRYAVVAFVLTALTTFASLTVDADPDRVGAAISAEIGFTKSDILLPF